MDIEEHEALVQEDASPTADEVAGYPGTVEEAVENGQLEPPPPLSWQRWQVWRTATGSRPESLRIGSVDSAREALIGGVLWRISTAPPLVACMAGITPGGLSLVITRRRNGMLTSRESGEGRISKKLCVNSAGSTNKRWRSQQHGARAPPSARRLKPETI